MLEIRADRPDEMGFELAAKAKRVSSAEKPVIDIDGAGVVFEDGRGDMSWHPRPGRAA